MNPVHRVALILTILALPLLYVFYLGNYVGGIAGTVILAMVATGIMRRNYIRTKYIVELWVFVALMVLAYWEFFIYCERLPYNFCFLLK